MSMEYLGWGIAIVLLIFFPMWHELEALYRTKYVECYKEIYDEGGKPILDKMIRLGMFKSERFLKAKDCYELTFRNGLKTLKILSPASLEEYIGHWLVKRIIQILYFIDAYLFEIPLENPIEKEMGYKNKWKAYFIFSYVFSFNIRGICLSFFFVGMIAAGITNWNFIIFLLSGSIAIIPGFINTWLYKNQYIQPKKDIQTTTTEIWMVPIESKYEIVDIYEVEYEQREKLETGDKAGKYVWVKYPNEFETDKNGKPVLDSEEKPIMKKILVERFETIQDLKLNKNIKNLAYVKVREEERMRTLADMKKERKSFLSRNAYLWKMIISGRGENNRLQEEVRSLHEQLVFLEETKDKEIKEFNGKIMLERKGQRNTLKDIIGEIYGAQLVNTKWEQVTLNAMRVIESEKQKKKEDQMDRLIQGLDKLYDKIASTVNINVDDLKNLLKIKPEEMIAPEEGSATEEGEEE